jgi:hypothetical protein
VGAATGFLPSVSVASPPPITVAVVMTAQDFAARAWSYVSGAVSRSFTLGLLGPLAIVCFTVGATLAIAHFPTSYDIRYRWISSLASARSNPSGYAYLGAAFMAIAVLLLPLPGYLLGRFEDLGRVSRAAWLLLWTGVVGMSLLGVETTVFPNPGRTRHAHHLFTALTLIGLTLGFLSFGALSLSRAWITRGSRVPACLACAVLSTPATGAGLLYLTQGLGAEAFGEASLRAVRHELPFFLRFTFWEWAAVIALFVGGYLAVWAASPRAGHRQAVSHPIAAGETPITPPGLAAARARPTEAMPPRPPADQSQVADAPAGVSGMGTA